MCSYSYSPQLYSYAKQQHCNYYFPGANFTLPESIILTEGETKEICVMVKKDNERNISLSFVVEPKSSASGIFVLLPIIMYTIILELHADNNDFSVVSEETVIPAGALQACLQLVAVDDNIVEGTEVFTVMVEPFNPGDKINGSTSVIISDNDGEDYDISLST